MHDYELLIALLFPICMPHSFDHSSSLPNSVNVVLWVEPQSFHSMSISNYTHNAMGVKAPHSSVMLSVDPRMTWSYIIKYLNHNLKWSGCT